MVASSTTRSKEGKRERAGWMSWMRGSHPPHSVQRPRAPFAKRSSTRAQSSSLLPDRSWSFARRQALSSGMVILRAPNEKGASSAAASSPAAAPAVALGFARGAGAAVTSRGSMEPSRRPSMCLHDLTSPGARLAFLANLKLLHVQCHWIADCHQNVSSRE